MENLISNIKEVKVHGRTSDNRAPLTLFWTASGFECNVSGSQLWVEVEVNYTNFEPWFSYTINGDWIGRQMLTKGRYWICLFRGMNPEKIKNVHFYKDVQPLGGEENSWIQIHSLRYDGVFFQVEDRPLKMEFIGDSITSGEGSFGARQEEDWIPMFFSALRDYSYLTAKKLNADYRVFSQSGWGLYNSWDNNPNAAIPKYYKEICGFMTGKEAIALGAQEQNDFLAWQPDVIVVNLGTNDMCSFEQPEWKNPQTGETHKMHKNADGTYCKEDVALFEKAVVDFLCLLRECNHKAKIIWCFGMLSLDFQMPIVNGISNYQDIKNDQNVFYLQLPETNDNNVGSRQHPGPICHAQAADVLSAFISSHLN